MELQTEKGRGREIFQLLVISQMPQWLGLTSGAWHSTQVFNMVGRGPSIICWFLRCISRQLVILKPMSIWDVGITAGSLTHCSKPQHLDSSPCDAISLICELLCCALSGYLQQCIFCLWSQLSRLLST